MFSSLDRRPWLPGALLALVGMGAIFLAMPHGAGLSPDSISYIEGGRSVARDHTLSGLNPHWPPFYPLLLALLATAAQGSLFSAAKLLCVAIAGVNVFVIYRLMLVSGWRSLFALLLSACIVVDPDLVNIHLMAWSEPIFLACVMSGMFALHSYLQNGRVPALYAAAMLLGLSTLTRYAGIAFVAAAGLVLLVRVARLRDRGARNEALLALPRFGLPALVPLVAWVLLCGGSGGSGVRTLQYHPLSGDAWVGLMIQVVDWFGGPWNLLLLICGLIALAVRCRGMLSPGAKCLFRMALTFAAVYLAFLIVSITFFDAYIPLDGRILSPLKLMVYLALFAYVSALPEKLKVLPVVLLCAFAFLVTYPATRVQLTRSSESGFGFAQPAFAKLPILKYLRDNHVALDACNSPELTLLYLDSKVDMLPSTFDPTTKLPLPAYAQQIGKLSHPGSTVAVFAPMTWRTYLPNIVQLQEAGFTEVLYRQADGMVLRHP